MHLNGRMWNLGKEASVQQPAESVSVTVLVPVCCSECSVSCLNHRPKALSKTLTSFVEYNSGKSPVAMPCDHVLTIHLYWLL